MHTPRNSEELIDSLAEGAPLESNYNVSQELDVIFNSIFSVLDSEPKINEDSSTSSPLPNTEPGVVPTLNLAESVPIESSVAPEKTNRLVFNDYWEYSILIKLF